MLFVVEVIYDGVVVDDHVADGSDNYAAGGDDHYFHNNEYDQEEEGDSGYHWVDGTPIGFLNWAEGEPNSADGNEAIMYFYYILKLGAFNIIDDHHNDNDDDEGMGQKRSMVD